ncbi:MAG: hypothetical protein KAI72_02770, partial [Candidatus Pacebacteria bacterium]|nr:hypothetical protein [Candidatus Paceibacterota bacterium]
MQKVNSDTSELLEFKAIWKQCLKIIKENIPAISYNTWFGPIKPIEYVDSILKIQVPNNFFIEWIDEHYNTLINNVIYQVLGENGKLVYVIIEEKESLAEELSIIEETKPEPKKPEPVSNIENY